MPVTGEAFGLILQSPIDLKLTAVSVDASVDVDVSVSLSSETAPPRSRFQPMRGEIVTDVGVIEVEGGSVVDIRARAEAPEEAIAHFVTGPALGLVLHQRHRLALHASAVMSSRGAALFVGDSGWGKSTIATACWREGAGFVTDDIASVDVENGSATTTSGPPWSKLWPDVIRPLGIDPARCVPVYPGQEKIRLMVEPIAEAAIPVETIYVIAEGPSTTIEPIGPRDAFVELTRHAYAAAILERTVAQDWHARAVGRLVRSTPIRRLVINEDLGELGRAVRHLIETHP